MKIVFERIDDQRHRLTVTHDDGSSESVENETRSVLLHDFLHYAIEREGRVASGFWGSLARGITFEAFRDEQNPELLVVERIVGALHAATKGVAAAEVVAGVRRYAEALGETAPAWVSVDVVERAQEHLRRMRGEWTATGRLTREWPG